VRAIVTPRHGGLDVLEYHDDWPDPEPAAGEVLVRVGACGLNNTDVNTRTGWYSKGIESGTGAGAAEGFAATPGGDAAWGGAPLAFPRIQGADVCGVVVGGDAGELLGRRVLLDPWLRDPAAPEELARATYLGSERDGGYAEYVVIPAANAYPLDAPMSDAELATFPTSYVTAANMLRRADLRAGETILITGASGGVGTALIQVARERGAVPFAVAGAAKADAVRACGAEHVVDREAPDLAAAVAEAGAPPIDVVADVVGGARFPELLPLLRRGGRYTCAGAIAGPIVPLDLRTMYLHDLTLIGATVPPPHAFGELVGLLERGRLRPLLAATFPLERFRDAQEAFIAKRHVGNIVIDVGGAA
jgi:NADPH:quinone reductase-like Zn-dependent oxidoreductase